MSSSSGPALKRRKLSPSGVGRSLSPGPSADAVHLDAAPETPPANVPSPASPTRPTSPAPTAAIAVDAPSKVLIDGSDSASVIGVKRDRSPSPAPSRKSSSSGSSSDSSSGSDSDDSDSDSSSGSSSSDSESDSDSDSSCSSSSDSSDDDSVDMEPVSLDGPSLNPPPTPPAPAETTSPQPSSSVGALSATGPHPDLLPAPPTISDPSPKPSPVPPMVETASVETTSSKSGIVASTSPAPTPAPSPPPPSLVVAPAPNQSTSPNKSATPSPATAELTPLVTCKAEPNAAASAPSSPIPVPSASVGSEAGPDLAQVSALEPAESIPALSSAALAALSALTLPLGSQMQPPAPVAPPTTAPAVVPTSAAPLPASDRTSESPAAPAMAAAPLAKTVASPTAPSPAFEAASRLQPPTPNATSAPNALLNEPTESSSTAGELDLSALIAFSAAVQAGQFKDFFDPQPLIDSDQSQDAGAGVDLTTMDGIQPAPPLPIASSTLTMPSENGDLIVIDFADLEGKALAGDFGDASEVFPLAPSNGPSVYKPPPLFPLAGPTVAKPPARPPPRSVPARPPASATRPPAQAQPRPSTPVGARPSAPRPPTSRPPGARPPASSVARPPSYAPLRPPATAAPAAGDPQLPGFDLAALEAAVFAGREDEFLAQPPARPPQPLAFSDSRPPTLARPPQQPYRPAVARPAAGSLRPSPHQRSQPPNGSSLGLGTTPVRSNPPRPPAARAPTTSGAQAPYARTTTTTNVKAGPSSQAPRQGPSATTNTPLVSLLDAPFSATHPAMVLPSSHYSLSEKRQYLSLLPAQSLVNIILRLTDSHPTSPAFPANIKDVILDLEVEALKPRNRSASPSPLATTPMLQRTSSAPGVGSAAARRSTPAGSGNSVGRLLGATSTARPPPVSRPSTPAQPRPLTAVPSGPLMPSQSQPMTNGASNPRPPLLGQVKPAVPPVNPAVLQSMSASGPAPPSESLSAIDSGSGSSSTLPELDSSGMAAFAAALQSLVDGGLVPQSSASVSDDIGLPPPPPSPADAALTPASAALPSSLVLPLQATPSAFSAHAIPSPAPSSPVLPPPGTDFTLAPLPPTTVNSNAQAGLAALLAQLTPTS